MVTICLCSVSIARATEHCRVCRLMTNLSLSVFVCVVSEVNVHSFYGDIKP